MNWIINKVRALHGTCSVQIGERQELVDRTDSIANTGPCSRIYRLTMKSVWNRIHKLMSQHNCVQFIGTAVRLRKTSAESQVMQHFERVELQERLRAAGHQFPEKNAERPLNERTFMYCTGRLLCAAVEPQFMCVCVL